MKNQPTKRLFLSKVGHTAMLAFTLVALTACGQKDNKVTGNVGGYNNNGPLTGTQYNTPNLGSNQIQELGRIKAAFPCRQGSRIQQDITFHTQGYNHSGSRTTIGGSFSPGPIGGNVSSLFVGVSAFNDIMVVTRVGSGSQVMGYNVTLSMCSAIYQQNNLTVPLIDNNRPLSNFTAPNGIVLGIDNYCNYGAVDSALMTTLTAGAVQIQNQQGIPVNLTAYTFPTTFYKASCNGQY